MDIGTPLVNLLFTACPTRKPKKGRNGQVVTCYSGVERLWRFTLIFLPFTLRVYGLTGITFLPFLVLAINCHSFLDVSAVLLKTVHVRGEIVVRLIWVVVAPNYNSLSVSGKANGIVSPYFGNALWIIL